MRLIHISENEKRRQAKSCGSEAAGETMEHIIKYNTVCCGGGGEGLRVIRSSQ